MCGVAVLHCVRRLIYFAHASCWSVRQVRRRALLPASLSCPWIVWLSFTLRFCGKPHSSSMYTPASILFVRAPRLLVLFFDRAPQVVLFSRTRRDFCYFSWEILSCASLRQAPYEAYGVYLLKECRATTTKFEKKQSELPQHWLSLTESAIFQARCPNAKFRSVSHSSRDARVRLLVALLLTLDNHV